MDMLHSVSRGLGAGAVALLLATVGPGCSPDTGRSLPSDSDPGAVTGEFVTYVADYNDGHSETWHALRTADGKEVRLDFDTPPGVATGTQVRVHGDPAGEQLHVNTMDVVPTEAVGAEITGPALEAAPSPDSYALVLVDLGSGVNLTAAQGMAAMVGPGGSADKSFAEYYNESSYGTYQVTGAVVGPFPYTMTTCDTTGMYQAIEPMITTKYNHLIYYFNETSLCDFGGLGEEGSSSAPAKRTWMNGSLSCVVLMQEPGHNLGLMHANTIKCGTSSFSTTPATSCTITEYGSTMTTMGSGCRSSNGYERWYMQWLQGCNGVRVPSSGTFNIVPLETSCPNTPQVLQVPFPATLTVNDPQATTTNVSLNDYYLELRVAGGNFDTYSTSGGRGGTVTFSGPTVFIYASDNVHLPPTTTGTGGRGGGQQRQTNSVWTELINTTPSGTPFTGLTAAGQSFVDPAGGATITLMSISATGATINVSYPTGTGSPTCIDGSTFTAPGPTACSASPGTGGTTGAAGASGTGGATGTGGVTGTGGKAGTGGATGGGTGGKAGTGGTTGGTGGITGTSTGGTTGTGGGPINITGSGGSTGSSTGGATGQTGSGGSKTSTGGTSGGSTGSGGSDETGTGGCSCSYDPARPLGPGNLTWLALTGGVGLVVSRRRRRRD